MAIQSIDRACYGYRRGIDASMSAVRLVGRDAELADVAWLLSTAIGGCAGLSVVAPPGIGKSALLGAAQQVATDMGYRVLRCTGVEAEYDLASPR